MQHNELEGKITRRFDESAQIFPDKIDSSDFRIKAILDFFGPVNGKKILDIGCGKGRFARILQDNGAAVTGIDPSEELLKEARKNKGINFVKGSGTDLPFEDGSFDCILCVEVLEHVPDCKKAVREMFRVLASGGRLIIIDKNKLSLNRNFLVPNAFIKKYMELSNRWFYPKDFEFKEKWFFAWEINKIIKKHFSESKSEYLQDSNKRIFSMVPFANLFIIWKAEK